MSEMLKNFANSMNNPNMSDNFKNIFNNMANSNINNSSTSNNSNGNYTNDSKTSSKSNQHASCADNSEAVYNNTCNDRNNFEADGSSSTNNIFGNLDINTIMKIQQIMNSLNDKQSDSRSNLLMSLKPYLKESRKSKVDQYIQLMKIGKIFETMNPLGGGKKYV